jgi:hypothetical protein
VIGRLARVTLMAVALLGAACSDDGDDAQPAPTTEPTSSTTAIDRSGIALASVPGETTSSTLTERGTARLTGSVQGPDGLVVGATVRIERLVAGREVRTDLLSGPDGRFVLDGVPGGRYRVRAFLAPTLAQVEPDVRFLEDGAEHDFALVVEQQSGLVVRADVAPEPPVVGRAVNLLAVVSTRTVGTDGIVRSSPVVGATVELAGLGRWTLRDDSASSSSTTDPFESTTSTFREPPSPFARTDVSGRVRYELRCDDLGDSGLYLRIPVRAAAPTSPSTDGTVSTVTTTQEVTVQSVDLDLPDCVDPTTLTTTTLAPPSTTAEG